MKKLLLMLFCCILSVAAWSQQSRPPRVVSINGTYTSTRTLQPFLGSHNLHALAISGSVTLNSDTSLVRVIMHDVDGKSYLMYEASPMLINGYTETFTDANEETEWMCGVVPQDLKIVVKDATCTVTGLTATQYSADNHPLRAPAQRDSIRIRQVQAKVDKINAYNAAQGKLWGAGITELSMRKFSEKQGYLNNDSEDNDTQGIEYYIGGIFEIGPRSVANGISTNSHYVPLFDWRKVHGTNWNTPVRNQKKSGYCFAFATAGVIESLINLQYNRKIDSILSVEDIALYSQTSNYSKNSSSWSDGGNINMAASYACNKGISFENYMPFVDTLSLSNSYNTFRSDTCDLIFASGYNKITNSTYLTDRNDTGWQEKTDLVKSALINHGPLVGGFFNWIFSKKGRQSHAMVLVGYQTVGANDTVSLVKNDGFFKGVCPVADSTFTYLVGKTIWVFKDSYGADSERGHEGYMYLVYNSYDCMRTPIYFDLPIYSNKETNIMPLCVDRDGDGYYTWGFKQPKPASLPDWVPDEQDGDDSDYTKCTMDEYGFLQDLVYSPNDTIFIDSDQTFCGLKHLYRPIKVQNHATLTIASNIQGHGDASIVLVEGSHLDISNGTLENISIIGNGTSVINIRKNSRLNISHSNNNSVSLRRTQ